MVRRAQCPFSGVGDPKPPRDGRLAFVDHEAPAHGLTTVIARIFGHNQASRHLFQKFGYEHWGHLPAIATLPEGHADLEVYGKHFGI